VSPSGSFWNRFSCLKQFWKESMDLHWSNEVCFGIILSMHEYVDGW
jgi:hypothetical protein